MSRLTDLEEIHHVRLDDPEVDERLSRLLQDHNLFIIGDQDIIGLPGQAQNYNKALIARCKLVGNIQGYTFAGATFKDCAMIGNFAGNDFRDADFINTAFTGSFAGNAFQGAYLRYCGLGKATFASKLPSLDTDETNSARVIVHATTSKIIFCAGVEKSMVEPEAVAHFAPISLRAEDRATDIPFLARLYFDGVRKKLALISLRNMTFQTPVQQSKMWSGFIYTMSNENVDLRTAIIQHCQQNVRQNGQWKIAPEVRFEVGTEPVYLRPARPLDYQFLTERASEMHPVLKECLRLSDV